MSRDRWGASYERHGLGADYYVFNHVEYVAGQPPGKSWGGPLVPSQGYSGPATVGLGGSLLSLIGGNNTTDAMW